MAKKVNMYDEAIDKLFEERKETEIGSEKRKQIDAEIIRLSEAKGNAKGKAVEQKRNEWIGPLIGGCFGLAQILVVCHYEELSCLTSKALSFINKPKL